MNKVDIITDMITKLFVSRNQLPIKGLVTIWYDVLKKYDIEKLKTAFGKELVYGDSFPSLPRIIKIAENKKEDSTEAIEQWNTILIAVKQRTSKGLTKKTKEIMNLITSSGLTEIIESDSFRLQKIEKEFKSMYRDYDNIKQKQIKNKSTGTLIKNGLDISSFGGNK